MITFCFSRNTLKAMMPGRGSLSVLKMAVITATSNDNDALKKNNLGCAIFEKTWILKFKT